MNLRWVAVAAATVALVSGCGDEQLEQRNLIPNADTGNTANAPGSTGAAIAKLNAAGFVCKPNGEPFSTVYSYRTQTCTHPTGDGVGDDVFVAVYSTPEQYQAAKPYLLGLHTGLVYVFGAMWSADTPTSVEAAEVAGILGGVVVNG